MTKEIQAVYKQGMIRPLQPLELQRGSARANGNAAEMLAEIAALPLEGPGDAFPGREHDSILYPKEQG